MKNNSEKILTDPGFRQKYLEDVVCDLCGSADKKIIYSSLYRDEDLEKDLSKSFLYASGDKARGNVVRCRECGLVYITPRDRNISVIYTESDDDQYYFSTQAERKEAFADDLGNLEAVVGKGGGRKILDVGCGYGFFLGEAMKRGWDVYGLELSKKQASFAAKNFEHILNEPLTDVTFPENFFDVITLYDVVEHLPSPSSFVAILHKILKKDGLLVVSTPNFLSWPRRFMGRFWHCLIRMHLYYFTPKTIEKLLAKEGFKIIKIAPHRTTIRLGAVISWAKKSPALYKILNILFNNRLTGRIKIKTSFGGNNMIIYAKKNEIL